MSHVWSGLVGLRQGHGLRVPVGAGDALGPAERKRVDRSAGERRRCPLFLCSRLQSAPVGKSVTTKRVGAGTLLAELELAAFRNAPRTGGVPPVSSSSHIPHSPRHVPSHVSFLLVSYPYPHLTRSSCLSPCRHFACTARLCRR
eukprot:3434957-Rhodomonas_salina.4